MSLGGLITGALGGAAKGYTQVAEGELDKANKLDLQREISKMDEEKQLRIDAIRRDRDVADIGRRTDAETAAYERSAPARARVDASVAPIVAEGQVAGKLAGTRAAIDRGLPAAQAELKGAELKSNAGNVTEEARQAGAAEGVKQTARVGSPGYIAAVRKEAQAKHVDGVGAVAQANLANFELAQKKAVADLREKLAKEPKDSPAREGLTQQIQDLSGGSQKSYADMVTAGDAFRKLAANLRAQLKDDLSLTPADQEAIKERIKLYEDQAASVLGATVDKRLGGGTGQPKPGPTPDNLRTLLFGNKGDAAAPAPAPAPGTPAPAPAAAKKNEPPKPLPSSLTPDVDARAAKAREQAERDAAKRTEEAAQKKAWNDRLREQAAGLTPDRIRVLEPVEAQKMLDNYGSVLSPEQRRELNKRL